MTWKDGSAAGIWLPTLNAIEAKYRIPHDLLARQCAEESHFNPEALNPSGAIGIMQLLPKFFSGAGKNPSIDIETAADYMAGKGLKPPSLFERFNDWQLALAGYDWGPTALAKKIKAVGKLNRSITLADLPPETQKYVSQIITDVPVAGILCKTPSLPSPQEVGSLLRKPSVEPSLVQPPPKSLWQSVTGIFTHPSDLKLPPPSPRSVWPSPLTSFLTPTKESSMSTSNPVLSAAAPTLIKAVGLLQTALSTILTGDPAQIALRAPPAAAIFVAQLQLLLPELASSEVGAVNTEVQAKLGGLVTKLQALVTPAPAPAAVGQVSTQSV
jgi:Transglycosylase SLT domain